MPGCNIQLLWQILMFALLNSRQVHRLLSSYTQQRNEQTDQLPNTNRGSSPRSRDRKGGPWGPLREQVGQGTDAQIPPIYVTEQNTHRQNTNKEPGPQEVFVREPRARLHRT